MSTGERQPSAADTSLTGTSHGPHVQAAHDTPGPPTSAPTWSTALGAWVAIALQSFGGPAGQLAAMHRILVTQRRWLTDDDFLHALQFCMLLPGPEAQQMATWIGWRQFGWRGGLAAGLLFVLPGFISLWVLSVLYWYSRDVPAIAAALAGIQASVVVLVVEALTRIGRRVLKSRWQVMLAVIVALLVELFRLPFALALVGGALVALAIPRPAAGLTLNAAAEGSAHWTGSGWPSLLRTTGLWLAIWWLPTLVVMACLGSNHLLAVQGRYFGVLAFLSFGGAYAVLAELARSAVERLHWVTLPEMQAGLGFAESTPGPLIQVVQYVAFLSAARSPAPFDPLTAGTLASVLCTWSTFAPSFLWIFALGPYAERLRHSPLAQRALSGISAVVVGVILQLGWTLARTTLWPDSLSLEYGAAVLRVPQGWPALGAVTIVVLSAALVWGGRWNPAAVVIVAALAGWLVGR